MNKDELQKEFEAFTNEEEMISVLCAIFKMMQDPTRLKILYALQFGELNVTEIVNLVGLNQPAVSHQLQLLRDAKLIKFRKDGRKVYYSLDDQHVLTLMEQGVEHARHRLGEHD